MAVGEASPPRAGVLAPARAELPDGAAERLRERIRVVACCLALTAMAFGTRPGAILADTKIDMALDPFGFLGRALHPWDPEQFGQLQNQAVGYLFPMGAFHALGDLAGLPAWITQRCWLALLMCLAFTGVRRLAGRLGLGAPTTRMLAALAYTLAPNGLATLGQISSEYMPVAMLPWIVLPLVGAASGECGRVRAAARSGLAVACCGGVNATATVAVLVVPFVYVVTRPRGTSRPRLLAWWSAAVAAATAWWLVPLLLTGRYGFSWLPYTERASTTTGPTGLVNVLRGAERWVNYLVVDGQVWWPVGHGLSMSPPPMLCTGAVAALGLAGLLRRPLPERTFLLLTLLAGLTILSAGHLSGVPGPLAAATRDLLDGPLGPLRNLHKFDAVVRLPLALGLAHLPAVLPLVGRGLRNVPPGGRGRRDASRGGPGAGGGPRWGDAPLVRRGLVSVPAAAFVALGGIGVTAVSHGLSGPGDFKEVPPYWRDAASWLNERAGHQGVLALPGTPFGEHLWGRPMDDIMQPLLDARWGVRQLVPVGSPGYTRVLDAIDRQTRSGRASPGLAAFLGRMGVRYVLVRNDLRRETLRGALPSRLHQALDGSPGLRRAAAFGGPAGWDPVDDAVSATDQPRPAVEVYEVDPARLGGPPEIVTLAGASRPVRVYGGPESLLPMADDDALPRGPVLMNDDAPDLGGTPVVTDAPRLVRRAYGELHQTSPTLSAARSGDATDVLDDGWDRYATHVTYGGGVRDVTASSSLGGDHVIAQAREPGAVPYAAFDGDPSTAWRTGGWDGPVGQWLRVDFDGPREVGALSFVPADTGVPVARVAVETERGVVEQAVGNARPLRAPDGPTRWLRLRITGVASPSTVPALTSAGVAELSIGGVKPTRTFTLPAPGGAAAYVMGRAPGATSACMRGGVRWVCSPSLLAGDEEGPGFDRTFTSATPRGAPLTGTAVLTDQRLIDRYTAGEVDVTASSALTAHPAGQARSAFDRDPATTWIAAERDAAPELTVRWKERKRVSSVTLTRPPGASGTVRVRVEGGGGEARDVLSDARGRLRFAPLTTDRLTLTFRKDRRLQPVQITDLAVPGVRPLGDVDASPLSLPCGSGPELRLGGTAVETRVTGMLGDLLTGRPLRFTSCGRPRLVAGPNHLTADPRGAFRVETVTVGALAADAAAPRPVRVLSWGPGSRTVGVDAAGRSFLTVDENFNAGWRATVGGTELRPVRLDGWKQGWLVPAGTKGVVRLTYGPDRAQRAAIALGLGMLAVLLLVAARPGRRRAPRFTPLPGGRGWPAWAAIGLAAALGCWVAGPAGLAVAAASAAGCGRARTGRSRAARALASPWTITVPVLAGTACLAAGSSLGLLGNPGAPSGVLGDVAPQLLALAAVGRVAAELWRPGPPGPSGRLGPSGPAGTGGRIELSWTVPVPIGARGDAANGAGPAAAPAPPPGGGSASPLRWTPPPSAGGPWPPRPGTAGPPTRTSRR